MMFALVMAALSYFSQTAHTPASPLLSPIPEEQLSLSSAYSSQTSSKINTTPQSEVLGASIEAISSPSVSPTPTITSHSIETVTTPSPTIIPQTTIFPTPTATPTQKPTPEATVSSTLQQNTTPAPTPSPSPSFTPSPTPTNKPLTAAEIDAFFSEYAQKYNVDKDQLKRIAKCESGLNPKATNLYYGGLFQFSPASWKSYRKMMGKRTDPDLRFDPEAAINTAAYLISTGRASAWPNCK